MHQCVVAILEVVHGHVGKDCWGLPAAHLQDGAEAFSARYQVLNAASPESVEAEAVKFLVGVDVVGEAGVLLQRGLEGSDLLHENPRASAGFGFVPEVPKAAHSAREIVVLGGCLAAALEVHDARQGVVLPPPEVDVALHWEEALWEGRGVEFPDNAGVPRCGQGVRRDHLPCFPVGGARRRP